MEKGAKMLYRTSKDGRTIFIDYSDLTIKPRDRTKDQIVFLGLVKAYLSGEIEYKEPDSLKNKLVSTGQMTVELVEDIATVIASHFHGRVQEVDYKQRKITIECPVINRIEVDKAVASFF